MEGLKGPKIDISLQEHGKDSRERQSLIRVSGKLPHNFVSVERTQVRVLLLMTSFCDVTSRQDFGLGES